MIDLTLIWILIIGFGIIMYVLLDGFTLGTGMLMSFMNDYERNLAMSMILPNWDGNQTWLVLGAATLYGAFPTAFSLLLPALYLPLFIMIIALLFRGVAFEFRLKADVGRKNWDRCFIGGSLVATFIQGMLLGTFIQGFALSNNPLMPISSLAWISPFSLFTGLGLVFGYCLLGAGRLVLKTEHSVQDKMYGLAKVAAILVAICAVITTIWTPFVHPLVEIRWFHSPYFYYIAILPIIGAASMLGILFTIYKRYEALPYWLTIVVFLCSYAGFIISVWPYIIPYSMTIWQAASPHGSLLFMLVGACIMLPILLFYTWYSYRIFRGKVKDVISY
jgi:cytochrome d ubiquinol oxidase subunit II